MSLTLIQEITGYAYCLCGPPSPSREKAIHQYCFDFSLNRKSTAAMKEKERLSRGTDQEAA